MLPHYITLSINHDFSFGVESYHQISIDRYLTLLGRLWHSVIKAPSLPVVSDDSLLFRELFCVVLYEDVCDTVDLDFVLHRLYE